MLVYLTTAMNVPLMLLEILGSALFVFGMLLVYQNGLFYVNMMTMLQVDLLA